MPRVMNVDKNPAYPAAVEALKADGVIPRRVRLRQCKYLNNLIEQDHRTVEKRVLVLGDHPKPASRDHLKTGQLQTSNPGQDSCTLPAVFRQVSIPADRWVRWRFWFANSEDRISERVHGGEGGRAWL